VYFGDAAGEVRPPVEEASAKFSGARMSFTSAAEEGVPLTAAGLNSVADAVASALDSILQAGQEISPREIQLTAIRVRGLLAAIQESSPADLPRLYESLKARNLVYVEILEGLR
jgi:hypothetical protein